MAELHDILLVAIVALVTIARRFLPFWIFGENRTTPPLITHLGKVLPFAIMGMLVVYCLKDVSLTAAPSVFRRQSAVPWLPDCISGSEIPC